MKVLILGGDKRYLSFIDYFKNTDLDVVGFDSLMSCKDINDIDISSYDVIILPIKGIGDDYSIDVPLNSKKIMVDNKFISDIKDGAIVLSGVDCEILNKSNVDYIKFMDDEVVARENGILTAEGIIADVIANTSCSLKKANVIVLGYGNIGKPLVKILTNMDALVSVGIITLHDYNHVKNSFLTNLNFDCLLKEADIIINTVPKMILDKNRLSLVNSSCYLLDVSSKPYGIDYDYAKDINLNIKQYSGIPGKISPKSASDIILKKIKKIIKDV